MRQRLTALTLDIYRRDGLDAVSFRRLAEEAGISHTLPYRYFDSKEALLAAVRVECTYLFERFVRSREPAGAAPLVRIRAVGAAYVEFVQLHRAAYELVFSTHQPPPDQYPELLAARRSFFEHAVEMVQEAINDGALEGDARQIAHLFWAALHGLITLHIGSQLVHGARLEELALPMVERMLTQSAPRAAITRITPRKERTS